MLGSNSGSHGNNRNQPYNDPRNQQYNASMNQQNNVPVNQQAGQQNLVNCRKCNEQIPSGSKFCLQCGEKVSDASVCTCGQQLAPNAKFCLECGKKTNG